jgi:glycosyltransferase involved in cell wall biosynthesis
MRPTPLAVIISSLTIGGAEQLLLDLLTHMRRDRFVIKIYFLRSPGILGREIIKLGFEVRTNIIRSRFDPVGAIRMAHLLKADQIEAVLLINHLNTLFFGMLAAKMARVPVCINWHNETFKTYPWHRFTMLGRRILHLGVDKVVAAAYGHKDYIARVEKIPAKKIETIYNGVDPTRFFSNLDAAEARKRLNIPAKSPVVSIIAVLRPDKAHEIFLMAAKSVLDKLPQTHFLIIGDGPQKEKLTRLANELDIVDQVHFMGFQRDLADILAAVDVNTLSSKPQQETLSVAALEAMSAGIPIVCTDVGFMGEIVITGETGYMVPVGDHKALAARLIELFSDRMRLKKMGLAAKRLVDEKLSSTKMARGFEDLIGRLNAKSGWASQDKAVPNDRQVAGTKT